MSFPFDYLKPELNRPDIYSEQSTIKSPRGPSGKNQSFISNILIIVISALIFITLIAWADVLRSYIDSININEIIKSQTKSRFWFAIFITLISCFTCLILYYFYHNTKKFGHRDFIDFLTEQ